MRPPPPPAKGRVAAREHESLRRNQLARTSCSDQTASQRRTTHVILQLESYCHCLIRTPPLALPPCLLLSLLSLFQDAALRIGCIYLSLSLPSSSLPSPAALQPCSTSIPLSSSTPLAPLRLLIPLFCEHKKIREAGEMHTPRSLCNNQPFEAVAV